MPKICIFIFRFPFTNGGRKKGKREWEVLLITNAIPDWKVSVGIIFYLKTMCAIFMSFLYVFVLYSRVPNKRGVVLFHLLKNWPQNVMWPPTPFIQSLRSNYFLFTGLSKSDAPTIRQHHHIWSLWRNRWIKIILSRKKTIFVASVKWIGRAYMSGVKKTHIDIDDRKQDLSSLFYTRRKH